MTESTGLFTFIVAEGRVATATAVFTSRFFSSKPGGSSRRPVMLAGFLLYYNDFAWRNGVRLCGDAT